MQLRSYLKLAFLLAVSLLVGKSEQYKISNFDGFINPEISDSSEGHAVCVSGIVEVSAKTKENQKLLFNNPANQFVVTAAMVELLQTNSSLAARVCAGPATVSGTFKIAAKLCVPKRDPLCAHTVQFLIHGINFNQSYWDFARGYSFIDAATKNGYATFSYDRLGVGASDHPDPIQVVQTSLQVEIAQSLISGLRKGVFGGQKFQNVVGVGHSFGAIQAVGVAERSPEAFDALVLTGFSTNSSAMTATFADFNNAIASQNQPTRFGNLTNGYLVPGSAISSQFAFFHYPNFDSKVFITADAGKETYTFGELFTLTSLIAPNPAFTGPVDVVLGEFDWIFALGNSKYPTDQAALVTPLLFPSASKGSRSWIVPDTGHALNLHYRAGLQFDQIQRFVKDNGF